MSMKKLGLLITLAALAGLLCVATAFSQEDIMQLKDPAFGQNQRPAAVFQHDMHNEKAEIDDCAACHHVYEKGQKLEDEDSVGTSCSECHTLKNQGKQPGLMLAYHKQCKSCHVAKGVGPVTCAGCHQKK